MVFILAAAGPACGAEDGATLTVEEVGERLFFSTELSFNRSQSCATCHDPERGFVDARLGPDGRVAPVSLGDDGRSRGRRNAPTAAYAAFAPAFDLEGARRRFHKQNAHRAYEGPLGGLFLDGRAADLAAQAGGPPLDPAEMGMPDEAAVVARIREDAELERALSALHGAGVLDDPSTGYRAVVSSIAAFERTEAFAPFDSRYDRHLRGELELTFLELTGKSLFFSEFTSCAICHQLEGNGDPAGRLRETFTGYEFHNVGVPANPALDGPIDDGLLGRAGVTDAAHRGKFKVPTLRNVAVTGPYMHNGVFRELPTVLEFYAQFVDPEGRRLDPETGRPWAPAEVPETVSETLLGVGRPLTDDDLRALLCFLRALTDRRYEPLLTADGVDCGG